MTSRPPPGDDDLVPVASRVRMAAVLPPLVFGAACAVQATLAFGTPHTVPPAEWVLNTGLLAVPVVTGCLLSWRVPATPAGAALAWVGAAPAAVFAVEDWGQTVATADPWPAAQLMYAVQLGAWVWNLAGFVALCLVFPDGLAPGCRRRIVGAAVASGVFVNAVLSFDPGTNRASAAVPHPVVLRLPGPVRAMELVLAYAALLAVLGFATSRLVLRYRRGGEVVRQQVRWLMLGAATVPVLLAGGWIAQGLGAPTGVAFAGFLIAMLVAVPAAVAVAVLRYDLFDVDRLLGSSLAWLLTTLVSAAIFAGVVYSAAQVVGANSRLGLTGAAFVTAMCLLPLHRALNNGVGRLVDRERTVMVARVHEFVQRVRDGRAEPEGTEGLMRSVLGDPSLRLLIRLPGSPAGEYVDLAGDPASVAPDRTRIPLLTDGSEVGAILLGAASARRVRRAREVAVLARLPIEVSRLRLELRRALEDARSSRARLALSTAAERRRLARDLHDGAQQQIIAVGMRLRSVQRQLDPALPAHADLEAAVATLSDTVAELRRLAHGVRPSRLDDGLATALKALVADSPIPVDITVDDIDTSEVIATTAYFVVAEALTNALKHARATAIQVSVTQHERTLNIEVRDNGSGGARTGFGLTSVRDRVASIGGSMSLHSPPGAGTRLTVTI
jgi:signal transduction histidine kinase